MTIVIFGIVCFIAGVVACYFALRSGVKNKMNRVGEILNDIETLGENGYERAVEEAKALKKKITPKVKTP